MWNEAVIFTLNYTTSYEMKLYSFEKNHMFNYMSSDKYAYVEVKCLKLQSIRNISVTINHIEQLYRYGNLYCCTILRMRFSLFK